jgi:hypothetical protein
LVAKVQGIERMLKAANDERLDSFKELLSSIESGLADLLANVEKGGGAAAIEGMTKALSALRMPDVQFTAPAFNPTINVPAPAALPPVNLSDASVRALADALSGMQIHVEAEMPQGQAPTTVFNAPRIAKWDVRIPGQYGAPDRTMTLTPTYAKD